ncbi:patatin-like phospholipase family protein [Bosea sp. LjRoot237]|uniref:patatin-like phospholipase family protein n=1 Tax=Bosea sp. LjRoot237 TaxID=3342292 RepID=UPI003ED13015
MNDLVSEPAPRFSRPRIGLALGGGAARGWAHIGVLDVLTEAGYAPEVIAGTSIGAVVGGCYAAGKMEPLREFALGLTKRRVVGLMDFHLGGAGLISGGRLKRLLERDLAGLQISELKQTYAAVATELGTGHEIWLTRGSLVDALRASYALPGVFDPVKLGGRWLMDGALVNPVPVTVARALGADVVLCVNLNSDMTGRGTVIQSYGADADPEPAPEHRPAVGWFGGMRERMRSIVGKANNDQPGLAGVMVDAFNITQDRISRSRLAGDPPDVMIGPKLGRVGLFDFHRADEAIALGRQAAERALDEIGAIVAANHLPLN